MAKRKTRSDKGRKRGRRLGAIAGHAAGIGIGVGAAYAINPNVRKLTRAVVRGTKKGFKAAGVKRARRHLETSFKKQNISSLEKSFKKTADLNKIHKLEFKLQNSDIITFIGLQN